MNNGLLLLSIGLTALIGSICTLLYAKLSVLSDVIERQNTDIVRLDSILRNVVEIQTSTQHCLNEVAMEMQLREVYQSADDRHKLAIKAAKNGKDSTEIMRQHGLSTDEAALIISLHGGSIEYVNNHSSDHKQVDSTDKELIES